MHQFPNVSDARRKTMSAIRSRGNRSTERRFRAALVSRRISGWVLHAKLQGRPDFLFEAARLAIFVDGCFWHSCPTCSHRPKSNRTYWNPKLSRNVERDKRNSKALRSKGISVLRFWECEIRDNLDGCMKEVEKRLQARKTLRP